MKSLKLSLISLSLISVLAGCNATAITDSMSEPAIVNMPTYKANIPASIMTPNKVETKYAGELTFVDGFPTDSTLEKTNDFMDTARAFELFESGKSVV